MPPIRSRVPKASNGEETPPPCSNRLSAILIHIPWYSIAGPARLAADVGVSRSTICRVIAGQRVPSLVLQQTIADALSRRLGYPIPVEEAFSTTGRYPTGSTCLLCDCDGCMPGCAYDRRSNLRPEWKGAKPGQWCTFPEEAVFPTTP